MAESGDAEMKDTDPQQNGTDSVNNDDSTFRYEFEKPITVMYQENQILLFQEIPIEMNLKYLKTKYSCLFKVIRNCRKVIYGDGRNLDVEMPDFKGRPMMKIYLMFCRYSFGFNLEMKCPKFEFVSEAAFNLEIQDIKFYKIEAEKRHGRFVIIKLVNQHCVN
ncbi:hypothetical protein RUM43_001382 [Polyplax serrata]|uniref:Uncharacterized protein n=1 Tax=Polyplax serrata TaxID=468196 RepID=A0AAN8SHZ2_POLSC